MKHIWQWMGKAGLAGALGLAAGCGGTPRGEPVTVASLAERLADPLWLARLDQEDTRIHTSYDRTGANEDYGTFLRDSDTPERELMRQQLEQTVVRAVEALPEELRVAINLREVDGLSYEEIAERMGCPIGTVRSRIFSG